MACSVADLPVIAIAIPPVSKRAPVRFA
jgi:hypothetical protein